MAIEKLIRIENEFQSIIRQWQTRLSPPQRKSPVAMPLKSKGAAAMASAKPLLLALYLKWQSEERKQIQYIP